jgi:hypothetical protein
VLCSDDGAGVIDPERPRISRESFFREVFRRASVGEDHHLSFLERLEAPIAGLSDVCLHSTTSTVTRIFFAFSAKGRFT